MHQLQPFAIQSCYMFASRLPKACSKSSTYRAKERTGSRFQCAVGSLPIIGRLPHRLAQDTTRCRAKLDLHDEEAATKAGLKPKGALKGGPPLPEALCSLLAMAETTQAPRRQPRHASLTWRATPNPRPYSIYASPALMLLHPSTCARTTFTRRETASRGSALLILLGFGGSAGHHAHMSPLAIMPMCPPPLPLLSRMMRSLRLPLNLHPPLNSHPPDKHTHAPPSPPITGSPQRMTRRLCSPHLNPHSPGRWKASRP